MNMKDDIWWYINDLYMSWVNERDPFVQRKIKEDLKSKVSPYELLMYSVQYFLPFKAFRNIFSLDDLFKTLEEMKKQGHDISYITNQTLVIDNIEDIQILNKLAAKEFSPEIKAFPIMFNGCNIFQYGDIKEIGQKFPNSYADCAELQQVEQMLKTPKDYKGIPITFSIENMGQLSLEKLNNIENYFDVAGIRIKEKERSIYTRHGEHLPIKPNSYKAIRNLIDNEVLSMLYVNENGTKMQIDYQLATQVLYRLADKIEYDHKTKEKILDKSEVKNKDFLLKVAKASGLVGLLTGKSICAGYSEILRNVLSCVGINSTVVIGETPSGIHHAWNQIQLGNMWFNADFTFARNEIREGKPSGDLFIPDDVFFGNRQYMVFDKDQKQNGVSIESTVKVGGHVKTPESNHKKCESYVPPYLTSILMERSKKYEDIYRKNGKSSDYKGAVPYVGSNTQKMRSNSDIVVEFDH